MHVLCSFVVAIILDKDGISSCIVRVELIVDHLTALVRYTKHGLYLCDVTAHRVGLASHFNCIFKTHIHSLVKTANEVKMRLVGASSKFAHFNPQPVAKIMHETALVNLGPLIKPMLVANRRELAVHIAEDNETTASEFEASKCSPETQRHLRRFVDNNYMALRFFFLMQMVQHSIAINV